MMYQQMDWPLIFCSSANGIEVALMGATGTPESASWQQWNLEDAGRAELPLVSNTNEERYPVGMAFCWGGVNRCLPMDEAGNCTEVASKLKNFTSKISQTKVPFSQNIAFLDHFQISSNEFS